jgi:hypothetical protein
LVIKYKNKLKKGIVMKKYCFLVNPTAGGGTCENRFKSLEDTIRKYS